MLLTTRARMLFVSCLAAGALLAGGARAQTKAECLSSYTKSQDFRKHGQLIESRQQLLVCVRPKCPALLRNDCTRWLPEVEQLTPSLVLGAHDRSGNDLVDVNVTMDGHPLAQRLDGKPISVDPGVHALHFEAAGHAPVDRRVVVREGQKARSIVVAFDGTTGFTAAGQSSTPAEDEAGQHSGIPASTLVFGGVAVVSLGAFGYFGGTGLSRWNKCHHGGCTAADTSYVNGRWIGADVALGLAVASAGLATWFYLSRDHSAAAPRVGVAPGFAMARFSF